MNIGHLLPLVLLFPGAVVAGDWPLHRGSFTQTGVSGERLPDTLAIRWEYKAGRSVDGTPVIADGVIYVGATDKFLHAIDLASGKAKWKAPIGPTTASPGVHGDRIYIGDDDGKFYCFDRATGKLIWTFETEGPGLITAGPNFAGDLVLIPAHDSTLYCLDSNGKKVWSFTIEGPIYGGVAVADGKTFLAGCDSLLHVLDVKTGKDLGSVDLKGQSGSAAAVLGDHLYVGTMSNQVLAVNLRALRIEWEFEAPKRKQGFYASAAVTDDLVVIGSRDNRVWAIDRNSGKSMWDFLTDHKVDGSAVIASGKVYVGSFDQRFYVLDLKGKKIQDFALDGAIVGSPAVSNGCVVVGTDKGTVYCLAAKE